MNMENKEDIMETEEIENKEDITETEEIKEPNIIKTIAPIPLENLKQYFEDKNTFFVIDYDNSTLSKDKLLTYLSNLEIPCDLEISSDEKFIEIYSEYLKFDQMVDIPLLEHITINFLLERKGYRPNRFPEYLKMWDEDFKYWEERLDSLSLYAVWVCKIPQTQVYVQNFERDETDSTIGINFVSLLKHPRFFDYFCYLPPTPKYFTKYFNDYMFKGNNLFYYWARQHNPIHTFMFGLVTGKLDPEFYSNLLELNIRDIAEKLEKEGYLEKAKDDGSQIKSAVKKETIL